MVKVTLSINGEIIKKAKQLGLNISRICENTLKIYIQAIEQANKQILQEKLSNQQDKPKEKGGIGTVGSDCWRCRNPVEVLTYGSYHFPSNLLPPAGSYQLQQP